MTSFFRASVSFGLVALMSLTALGAKGKSTRSVAFKQDSFVFNTNVDEKFNLPLTSLLKDLGTGKRIWATQGAALPAWLTLDKTAETLSGTPQKKDIAQIKFNISVADDENGGIAQMTINVINPPVWTQQNIDLGIQNEDKAMTPFDLKTKIKDAEGVTFTSPNLKPWMKLSTDGIITGTPKRADVGDYSGLIFVATSTGGTNQATGFGKVLITIKPPKWVSNPVKLGDTSEDASYSNNLKQFILDYEGSNFTYEPVSLPPWLQISSTGTLFGTPHKANLGLNKATVMFRTTILGVEYTDTTTFELNVLHVNHPPKWVSNPINLPDGATRVLYSQELSNSASDPDGDVLTYRIVSGPAWATMSANGRLSGTPQAPNVGMNSWQVEVKDTGGLTDVTTVNVNVIKSPEPPYWLAKPTILPKAKEDQSYSQDLTKYVGNPDNLALTFTLISGPAWATVSPAGTISGTPKAADVPLSKFNIRVANSAGSDVTDVMVEIEHTNHPPEWILNPINISVKEKAAMSVSIAGYAKDIDGDKLSFQLLDGPAWAQLSTAGLFTGTPQKPQVGPNTFHVRVLDQGQLFADATVVITVIRVNDPPVWSQITLPNAKEDVAYSSSVAQFASDADNDPLTFSKVDGPAWIVVGKDGSITGTPTRANVGVNEFRVRVMDPSNEFAVATAKITVEKVNKPPRWRQDPIIMADAFEDKAYSFSLKPYAVDDDNDPLTFKLVNGPSWMSVSADGMVTGTPKKADLGVFKARFEVSDGQLAAQADGTGTVFHTNHPPVAANPGPVFKMKERETLKKAMTEFVTDSDGDALSFSLPNAPDWVVLFSNGDLTLKPLHQQIGKHDFSFDVSDGAVKVSGTFTVIVDPDPKPPIWIEDPVKMEAKTNLPFNGSLAGKAYDVDNYALKFHKLEGPAWLTIAEDGSMSGVPKDADMGPNTFVVDACNPYLCTKAGLIITVKPGITIDVTQIDSKVPGAPTENLWVIDSSDKCSALNQQLKKNIHYYFDLLKTAEVHFTGVYLSSDAKKWDGQPVTAQSQPILLPWNHENPLADFLGRMKTAEMAIDNCSNCNSSPIWSMFRFYTRLPNDFSSIYKNGYFMNQVPMDAMIVTMQRDHYSRFASGDQKTWTPAKYAENFIERHTAESKPYRISAMAPGCPKLYTGDPQYAGPENAYKVLVDKTSGMYYAPNNCATNVGPFLQDFANKVIFRAYVHAKTEIKLSKKPMDPSTIKVYLGDMQLASDKWKYDATVGANGAIILNWFLIDQGQLKPGMQLRVEYRVN